MRSHAILALLVLALSTLHAQNTADCQLDIGTNLGGLADYGTELPFVNLMHNAREWYTKDVGNPNAAFNSEQAQNLSYRPDGYPTHSPQIIPESTYPQKVVTIWGRTIGWPAGQYVVLYEGTGSLQIWGSLSNVTQTGPGRMTFDLQPQPNGVVEITIQQSDINDPIHNIRLIMPGHEASYATQPFNPVWLEKLLDFRTVRFMDWGHTNNWGSLPGENGLQADEFDWNERARMDYYTWSGTKGIPYEMMVKLMNDYGLDGWVCVPHRASTDYSRQMAEFFRDNLDADRHLYVEYSNEIWNWIFDQTHWLNYYGCEQTGTSWPEGIVPYVQRCLDEFTAAYSGQMHRITRVVGTQLGWLDVSQRIANNMTPGTFDVVSPTWYFGLDDDGEAMLDQLGASATVADVAAVARQDIAQSILRLRGQKEQLADPLGLPLVFYEGGQHLTPHPFGVSPTYAQALLDIQRAPVMRELYQEWMDSIRTLQTGDEPLQLMHFSFVAPRSAQYGSWGMLETMGQDTSLIPAPKYSAVLNNMAPENCQGILSVEWGEYGVTTSECSATIHWSTRREVDNAYFIISRSSDGHRYTQLDHLSPSTSGTGQYQYVDRNLSPGRYIYRIRQVDNDGSYSDLGMRSVQVDCEDERAPVILFPNPVDQHLQLSTPYLDQARYRILSLDGRRLQRGVVDFRRSVSIPVGGLSAGIYQLIILPENGEALQQLRFVKQ